MATKLAAYVALNGRQYEDMTRQRNSVSSPFGCAAAQLRGPGLPRSHA